MQYTLYKRGDQVEGQLDSGISASDTTITLSLGDGAVFPQTHNGNTSSGGTSIRLNKTGIGASGIAISDFILNVTDGSHAFVTGVGTDYLDTTTLLGGSDNTWQNGDEYVVGAFIATFNKRNNAGKITTSEKAYIKQRSGDTLTVFTGGRGYDGTTPTEFATDDYVNIFVEARLEDEIRKAFAETFQEMDKKASINYVQAVLGQQNWKISVKCATTVAGNLATDFQDGSVVDGRTLVAGDRILIKNQASAVQNGIYTVNVSGAPTRATDFDSGPDATSAVVPVEQGTSNADTVWICTGDNPTIGVSSIDFTILTQVLIKAVLAEAQAGSNDTKYMTPYLVKEAIAAWGDIEDGTLAVAVSAGDITSNNNLMYQLPSDMKWYKVTSDFNTWYYRLGLALESGSISATVKIMTRGTYANQSFSNINPTFSASATGTDYAVGDVAGRSAVSLRISNAANGQAIVSGGTIRAKQVGTPSGNMLLYLVLNTTSTQEQVDCPAAYKDTSNNVMRGAIIASASIAQASFSGSYASMAFSFGSNIKIPAGASVHLVVAKAGAVNGSNYYVIDGDAGGTGIITLSETTMTWSNASNPMAGNYTLTVVSTSPVGYAVKAYCGSDGSYGITPTNRWSRVIGRVVSSSKMLFNPNEKRKKIVTVNYKLIANAASGFRQVTTNFCPSNIDVDVTGNNIATTPKYHNNKGYIDGSVTTPGQVVGVGNPSGTYYADDFLGGASVNRIAATNQETQLTVNRTTGNVDTNLLFIERLENGFYLYNGYPSGTGYIDGGNSGFSEVDVTCKLVAEM